MPRRAKQQEAEGGGLIELRLSVFEMLLHAPKAPRTIQETMILTECIVGYLATGEILGIEDNRPAMPAAGARAAS